MTAFCSVAGCDRPRKGRGLCEMHYFRQRRGRPIGGPEVQKRKTRGVCRVDGCSRADHGLDGLCDMHQTRLRREGSVGDPAPRISPRIPGRPTYDGAHQVVRRLRGPARDYECVDCGSTAAEWSYEPRGDAEELVNSRGRRYSTEPQDYRPRCCSCHRIFDRSHENWKANR